MSGWLPDYEPPDWLRDQQEQEAAARWSDAWHLLEEHGIVGPGDEDMTLRELERLASMIGVSK